MAVDAKQLLLSAAASGDPVLDPRWSARWDESKNNYLRRNTHGVNTKKFTWSAWIRPSSTAAPGGGNPGNMNLLGTEYTENNSGAYKCQWQIHGDSGKLILNDANSSARNTTNWRVFDQTGWVHVVIAVDTNQATETNRVKAFCNGVQRTDWDTNDSLTWPSQNYTYKVDSSDRDWYIGSYIGAGNFFKGYMSDFACLDNLAPSTTTRTIDGITHTVLDDFFGEFHEETGEWIFKEYSGSYGSNGFYLSMQDKSNSTYYAGKDTSGNNKHFTAYNFGSTSTGSSVNNWFTRESNVSGGTATGAGGVCSGSFNTWNALYNPKSTNAGVGVGVKRDGSLVSRTTDAKWRMALGTMAIPTTGKWYQEVHCTQDDNFWMGIGNMCPISKYDGGTVRSESTSVGAWYGFDGGKYVDGSHTASAGGALEADDIVGIAVDCDSSPRTVKFYKNNSLEFTQNFSTAMNNWLEGAVGVVNPGLFFGADRYGGTADMVLNNGARPFAHTAPSGYLPLCTQTLPTPTIKNPRSHIGFINYSGSAAAISGFGHTPTHVWVMRQFGDERKTVWMNKVTSDSENKTLYVGFNDAYTNQPSAGEDGKDGYITTWGTDGVTFSGSGGPGRYDVCSTQYSATQLSSDGKGRFGALSWDVGAPSTVTIEGDSTAARAANTDTGMSLIFWNLDDGNNTVPHGLDKAPEWWMLKRVESDGENGRWFHESLGMNKYIDMTGNGNPGTDTTIWNNTAPTATNLYVNQSSSNLGSGGYDYLLFAAHSVYGFSHMGSYVQSDDRDPLEQPYCYCGFRPILVILKGTGGEYCMWHDSWGPNGGQNWRKYFRRFCLSNGLTTATASTVDGDAIDFLSTGFRLRNGPYSQFGNNGTFTYAAWGVPTKYARGGA